LIPLLDSYSKMSVYFSSSSDLTTFAGNASYTVVYTSSSTYKLDLDYQNLTSTVWMLKDGTVLAILEGGDNITGSVAGDVVAGYAAGFIAETQAADQLSTYAASSSFHSNGTSTVTIGSSTFSVKNYIANSRPENISPCGSGTLTLSTYSLSVGTPAGSTIPLVTNMQMSGLEVYGGENISVTYSLQLFSLTPG
jgi:hypothetical protein